MTTNNVFPLRKMPIHPGEFPAPLFFDSLGYPCWTELDREDDLRMPIHVTPAWLASEFFSILEMPLAA